MKEYTLTEYKLIEKICKENPKSIPFLVLLLTLMDRLTKTEKGIEEVKKIVKRLETKI